MDDDSNYIDSDLCHYDSSFPEFESLEAQKAKIYSPALWSELRVFLAAAKMGSFSGGAKLIGTSQPSVSRQISSLEKHLGRQLFIRESQGVRLTEAGRDLAAQTAQLDVMISRLAASADSNRGQICGTAKIAASDSILNSWIIPFLPRLQKEHPHLTVDIFSSDTLFDGEVPPADLVITTRYNQNCSKACRRIGRLHFLPFVSRSYANSFGMPRRDQLSHHRFVQNRQFEFTPECFESWEALRREGSTVNVTKLSTAYAQMVRSGLGIGLLDSYHALDPNLIPLDWELAISRELYLYWQRDAENAALDAVNDFLVKMLESNPWFKDTLVTHSRDLGHTPVAEMALSRDNRSSIDLRTLT